MNNRQKSLKNLVYLTLGQLITIGFGLVLPRLWVVSYGSEINGLLNSLSQFLVYLSLFEAGIGTATLQALYRPIAQSDWDGINGVLAATNKQYRQTGRWYLIGLLALAVVYPLVVDTSLSYTSVFLMVFFSGIGNVVVFYFQGKYTYFLAADGKNYITTNLSTIISVLTSISKIVLIQLGVNVVIILAVSFMIHCIQAVYIMWYVRRNYPRICLDVPPDNAAISQKNFVLIHQISYLIFENTDVLLLTVFCDLRIVSVYSMFKLVTNYLEAMLNIPTNSINFALGQTFQTDKALYIKRIELVESYYSAVLYAVLAVTLFLYLPFMRLYTVGVTDVNYVDPWLAILFVLISLLSKSRTPMSMTINYAGHFRNTTWQTILEAVLNLTISLIGVQFLGIYGILLGTVVALLYRTNQIILYTNHKILHRSAKKTYGIYLVNVILFVLLQFLFNWIFADFVITSYLRFLVAGCICLVLALVVMVGGQTLLFSHCRIFVEELLRRLRSK